MIEATKLAFADSRRYSADPDFEDVPVEALLSKEFAKRRAAEIDLQRAKMPVAASLGSDTTEFVVGDADMAIAFIQTVFSGWGSAFMIPGAGILMTNRMRGFRPRSRARPNRLAPGKRTVHTLNTFLALRDGEVVLGGGTPGRDFQVQNNLQTLVGARVLGPRPAAGGRHAALGDLRRPDRDRGALPGRSARRPRSAAATSCCAWPAGTARLRAARSSPSTPDGGWAVASDLRGDGVALAV